MRKMMWQQEKTMRCIIEWHVPLYSSIPKRRAKPLSSSSSKLSSSVHCICIAPSNLLFWALFLFLSKAFKSWSFSDLCTYTHETTYSHINIYIHNTTESFTFLYQTPPSLPSYRCCFLWLKTLPWKEKVFVFLCRVS